MIEALGSYPIYNENGQSDEDCTIKVIEFPNKAPEEEQNMMLVLLNS